VVGGRSLHQGSGCGCCRHRHWASRNSGLPGLPSSEKPSISPQSPLRSGPSLQLKSNLSPGVLGLVVIGASRSCQAENFLRCSEKPCRSPNILNQTPTPSAVRPIIATKVYLFPRCPWASRNWGFQVLPSGNFSCRARKSPAVCQISSIRPQPPLRSGPLLQPKSTYSLGVLGLVVIGASRSCQAANFLPCARKPRRAQKSSIRPKPPLRSAPLLQPKSNYSLGGLGLVAIGASRTCHAENLPAVREKSLPCAKFPCRAREIPALCKNAQSDPSPL
jgi:hypothetical protein